MHRFELLEQRHLLSVAPILAPIEDVTLLAGAPLHIALDGFDADGDALSYSATSSDPQLLTPFVPEGNRSLRISVQDGVAEGVMELQLFEGRAPNTTARIIELAQSGFYDGLIFHRVIEDFMIQGGGYDASGYVDPGVTFDDEFHPDLQHTISGVLSMAKTEYDDTNGSQFFIIAGPTRHLDFNHSVFGFLTAGEDVRQAIAGVEVDANARPLVDVVMSSVEVFTDIENGVLMLSAPEGTLDEAEVTVTVSDGTGGTAQQTFHVNIVPDPNNGTPFLEAMDPVTTTQDTPVSFTLPGVDVEGDSIVYGGLVSPASLDLTIEVSETDGYTTVTPSNGLLGVRGIYVGVRAPEDNWDDSVSDKQSVPVFIHPPAPTGIELLAGSDTGTSDSDRLTRLNNTAGNTLWFRVFGVVDGIEVRLFADGMQIGNATASGDSVVIITDGIHGLADGDHSITAVQVLADQEVNIGNRSDTVDLASQQSAALQITVDAVAPQFLSTPIEHALQGEIYDYDVQAEGESAGLVSYRLTTSPAGMIIDATTGQITWTPTPGQGPIQSIVVRATDPAGNESQQAFDVLIVEAPLIDFLEFPGEAPVDGYRYAFQPVRSGRLTVEALFSHAAGDVDLTLFNSVGEEVGSSSTNTDNERIDLDVGAGEKYEFLVTGENPDVTFRLTNLLVYDNSELTVYGTDGNDTFEVIAGSPHQVTVNGVSYDDIDPATTHAIVIDGYGGDDTATVTGTDSADTATLSPNSARLVGSGYQIDLAGVSSVTMDGGGGDDVARLLDSSGNDSLVATPDYARLNGNEFSLRVESFGTVHAYATGGGYDVAKLFDSPGDDTFLATPAYGVLSGDGFYNRAEFFEEVHAYAYAGGNDVAKLYDSAGNDRFDATPTYGMLSGNGFRNRAKHFDAVYAYATGGGNDVARLYDSPGDDTFDATPIYGMLSGNGFRNRAKHFEEVHAYAGAGGDDVARLYDSPGDDSFVATPIYGMLSGNGFRNRAKHFPTVIAYGTAGDDVARLYTSTSNNTFHAAPTYAILDGDGFFNQVKRFGQVYAYATPDGAHVARLYGSPGDDSFVATPTYATFDGDGFFNQAKRFAKVYAYAGAGGDDVARLYDSPGDDWFVATPTYALLYGDGFFNQAKRFQRVVAYAGAGGVNFARLHDSPGDDRFVATPTYGVLYGDGFFNQAKRFDAVYAKATAGGYDKAYLYDSAGVDILYALSKDEVYLYNADEAAAVDFHLATAFDYVWARATTPGDKKLHLELHTLDFVLDAVGPWEDM